jgi:perosamine synthetase
MVPRSRLDIGWTDLGFAALSCLRPGGSETAVRQIASFWPGRQVVTCLSVRTAFDALLAALPLPPGSEVLMSAINIRDMRLIVEHHGLVPMPVDLDMDSLAIDQRSLEAARSERSRVIVVAHLFGSRMPLDEVAAFARQHRLLLVEDCAQAYDGNHYAGHPQTDVTLFSFGPIKTNTALGGGVALFRDRQLAARVAATLDTYPTQRRRTFGQRVAKYAALKLLSTPALFGLFAISARRLGTDHDTLISRWVRGFAGPDLFRRIRQRPSFPLLALLTRRLRRFDCGVIERRVAGAATVAQLLPWLRRPGADAAHHTHWVVPAEVGQPGRCIRQLWRDGFDATRGASSLAVIEPPPGRAAPARALQVMRRIVYLPIHAARGRDLQRLARRMERIRP